MSKSPRALVSGVGSSPLSVGASAVLMAAIASAAMWAARRHRAGRLLAPDEDLTPVVLTPPATA